MKVSKKELLTFYNIFTEMENIGWDLYDFGWTLRQHKSLFELIASEVEVDKDLLRYASEFIVDFIRAIENIDERNA